MKPVLKTLLCTLAFSIAMGFLEAAVVIYLRELYYVNGFGFPLQPMPLFMIRVEILREAATVIMLGGVGYMAGKTHLQRFAYFCFAFAVWDLWYYIFLYVFLEWPQSIYTWDLLFLIPLPWVGPVWAPCLLSIIMFYGSVFIICQTEKNKMYSVKKIHWFLLIAGSCMCVLCFLWDYLSYAYDNQHSFVLSDNNPLKTTGYIPTSFNTTFFLSGLLLLGSPVMHLIYTSLHNKPNTNPHTL